MASILVLDRQKDFPRLIAQVAIAIEGADVRHATNMSQARASLMHAQFDVLLIGPSINADDALSLAKTLRDSGKSCSVLLMADGVSTDLLRRSLKAGVEDVLEHNASALEIEAALRDAQTAAQRRAAASVDEVGGVSGRVITVFSTKGGVGKTVVATNLAVALAGLGKSVVLVDLDLHFGDVGIVLGLEPTRTVIGAVQSGDRLDAELLKGYLVDHSSGMKVLLAPTQPEDAEMVTASRIERILRLLADNFEYVIIDTAPSLDEAVLTALDKSSKVIAITMMDVASIKNTRVSLQKLVQLGYHNSTPIEVLLNRADSKVLLRPEDVEQAIGAPIKYRLPSDQQVPRSLNKGIPVVLDAPRSQPARVLLAIAQSIVDSEEVQADVA